MHALKRSAIALLATLALSGCAKDTVFYWGDYETSVYDRLVDNDDTEGEAHLKASIREAEQEGRRVPPGLYADYGFMLYRRGDMDGAIGFFDKERKTFPESTQLMTKLIDKIREKTEPAPALDSPTTPNPSSTPESSPVPEVSPTAAAEPSP